MKKILIPIDYHPTSEKVSHAGFELAKATGAEVCLIHVIQDVQIYHMFHPGFSGYGGYQMIQDVGSVQEAQKVAEEILKKRTEHTDVPADIHIAKGDPAKAILKFAKDWGADLIVIGTHSQNVVEKFLIGSVASEVLQKCEIPLYMVPVKK